MPGSRRSRKAIRWGNAAGATERWMRAEIDATEDIPRPPGAGEPQDPAISPSVSAHEQPHPNAAKHEAARLKLAAAYKADPGMDLSRFDKATRRRIRKLAREL